MRFEPDWTVPPGDHILDFLEDRDMQMHELAEEVGLEVWAVVVAGAPITSELAEGLHRVFGVSAEFWTNLEQNHRAAVARGATVVR
jgi:HTH-type transcriptional regulator / antitoxin HigA